MVKEMIIVTLQMRFLVPRDFPGPRPSPSRASSLSVTLGSPQIPLYSHNKISCIEANWLEFCPQKEAITKTNHFTCMNTTHILVIFGA